MIQTEAGIKRIYPNKIKVYKLLIRPHLFASIVNMLLIELI